MKFCLIYLIKILIALYLSKGFVGKSIEESIEKHGYRLLDCAQNYLNEDEVGDAVYNVTKRGLVTRDEIFITSKLNNPYHHK